MNEDRLQHLLAEQTRATADRLIASVPARQRPRLGWRLRDLWLLVLLPAAIVSAVVADVALGSWLGF